LVLFGYESTHFSVCLLSSDYTFFMTAGTEQNRIRKIIHIDMDAFFASVEQRDFPRYRNRPVVVGGSPQGRGVVAAASYEARKYGIHSAMPASKAVRLCPSAIFLKPRFDEYKKVSYQIRDIFLEYTDLVEPLSLDEAFLDVTENRADHPSATLLAREIKKKIRDETGLTASAGISFNKFLAKMASDINKPDGLYLITPDQAEEFLENLDIARFHGVGKATQKKMELLGIYNGKDLKKWNEIDLVKEFGKAGHHYYRIVRGLDHREVKPDRIRKSIGKERTFSEDISDIGWIQSFIAELSESVSASMKNLDAAGKTVTLKVRYKNFETVTRSSSLNEYTNSAIDISKMVMQLLEETEAGNREVRLLGITLSNLDLNAPGEGKQLELPFS